MDRNSLLIFAGLLLVAAAVLVHAKNGRYTFSYDSGRFTYAKLDTRTGEAWLCGAELDDCIPMTNKAAFVPYANRANFVEQARRAGFSDDEIKQWLGKHSDDEIKQWLSKHKQQP